MRICIIDTYYPEVIRALPVDPALGYEANLRKILDFSFGSFDAYSRNLRALGWDAVDVIANHANLQQMWAEKHMGGQGRRGEVILDAQVDFYNPDVIFMQDLSIGIAPTAKVLAGQCSCAIPQSYLERYDVIFTSLPNHVKRIEALGVRAVYNPLAFDPIVLERLNYAPYLSGRPSEFWPRIHDVVFIGGVGNPSHWRYGMEVLETVAREIPTFKWWGYGIESLPANSALRGKYMGEAYGLDMYEILLQSKICLNRHGEVAEGYANNMRMFEATGCGALLLTEAAPNLSDFFAYDEAIAYTSPENAANVIDLYLNDEFERHRIARNGQARTLRDHTYQQRMKTVSDTLTEMLCPA